MGDEIEEYNQYLAFIAREKGLNFAIFLTFTPIDEKNIAAYQKIADEIKCPIFFVNSAQFGWTDVFIPKEKREKYSPYREYTEGIVFGTLDLSKIFKPAV